MMGKLHGRSRSRAVSSLTLVLLTLAVAGCAKGKGTVSGKVLYQGNPLPSGTVTFYTADNKVLSAEIGEDGSYKIADVPAGPVKISVATYEPVRTAPGAGPPRGMMMDPSKMGASPEVGAQKTPVVQTQRPKKYVAIPGEYKNPETSNLTYTVVKGEQNHNIELK